MYILSVCFFYASIFVIGTQGVANIFQPAAPYFFNEFYSTDKVWIFLLVLPFFALIPDFIYIVARQNFFPNPSDKFILNSMSPEVRDDTAVNYIASADKQQQGKL